jgi:hypothetical protein
MIHFEVNKAKIQGFCMKWKVKELALFGSVLREDFRPNSDIDVLVRDCRNAAALDSRVFPG